MIDCFIHVQLVVELRSLRHYSAGRSNDSIRCLYWVLSTILDTNTPWINVSMKLWEGSFSVPWVYKIGVLLLNTETLMWMPCQTNSL